MISNKRKVAIISESVTMPEILQVYGIQEGKHGRIACPIHGGHNKSSFSYNDHQFQCFNCGAKGGVLQFVKAYIECDFEKALEEINQHFRLWSIEDESQRPSLIERMQRKEIRRKREENEKIKVSKVLNKEKLILELHRLMGNSIKHIPTNESDEWHPLYVESLKSLEIIKFKVDCL